MNHTVLYSWNDINWHIICEFWRCSCCWEEYWCWLRYTTGFLVGGFERSTVASADAPLCAASGRLIVLCSMSLSCTSQLGCSCVTLIPKYSEVVLLKQTLFQFSWRQQERYPSLHIFPRSQWIADITFASVWGWEPAAQNPEESFGRGEEPWGKLGGLVGGGLQALASRVVSEWFHFSVLQLPCLWNNDNGSGQIVWALLTEVVAMSLKSRSTKSKFCFHCCRCYEILPMLSFLL